VETDSPNSEGNLLEVFTRNTSDTTEELDFIEVIIYV